MRQQETAVSRLLTVILTEEQCKHLGALFRERLESHELRKKTGYPQDEEGARLAKELWMAFLSAVPQNNGHVMGKR